MKGPVNDIFIAPFSILKHPTVCPQKLLAGEERSWKHCGGKGTHRGALTADGSGACARRNPPAVQLEGERRGEAGRCVQLDSIARPPAQ